MTNITKSNPTSLLAVIPKSVPQAKQALDQLERDIEAAQTYKAIRSIERAADAIKLLFAEVEEVRRKAEVVAVLANHRIGKEITARPVAKGAATPRSQDEASPPTLKDLVGSTTRGTRLKQLAAIGRDHLMTIVKAMHAEGREATVTGVLKHAAKTRTAAQEAADRAEERSRQTARKAQLVAEAAETVELTDGRRKSRAVFPPFEPGKGCDYDSTSRAEEPGEPYRVTRARGYFASVQEAIRLASENLMVVENNAAWAKLDKAEITDEVIAAAEQVAEAWTKCVDKLHWLRADDPDDEDGGLDIPPFLDRRAPKAAAS